MDSMIKRVNWHAGPIADIFFHHGAEEEMTIHCFCSRAFVKYVSDPDAVRPSTFLIFVE